MKKITALMLALLLVLTLSACGKKAAVPPAPTATPAAPQSGERAAPPAAPQSADPGPAQQTPPDSPAVKPADAGNSPWLNTKTGQFYSRFGSGKMHMEYEMEFEGTVMTVISATSGEKTYSEVKTDGQSTGISIMDGEDMYVIDHANKMVIKTSLQATGQELMDTVIEEADVDPSEMQAGTREIDGKTYDTEKWTMDGAASTLCFDGDDLAYMIGEFEGEEMLIRVITVDDQVDDSLFELPEGYQELSF